MNFQDFDERFQNELVVLRSLFGWRQVEDCLPRIKKIYEYTEEKWQAYADQLPDGIVRYVLIGEAPPFSQEGTPQYLLDPESQVRTLMRALRKVFTGSNSGSAAETLKVLAAHGFLLLDSIPFSMKYSSNKRSRQAYDDLVRMTTVSYLQAKIDSSQLNWSSKIRVAFALKLNALSILKATSHLTFGGRPYPISTHMIAVNDSNYPDASLLSAIYGF